jgi:hypothetical protein
LLIRDLPQRPEAFCRFDTISVAIRFSVVFGCIRYLPLLQAARPHPLFAAASGGAPASAICRCFRRRARIRYLPLLQAARPHPLFAVASGGAPGDGDGRAEGEAVDICGVNTC